MPKRTATVVAAALTVLAALISAALVGAAPPSGRGRPAATLGASAAATDPLDPLSADEIQTTFKVIEQARNLAPGTFFPIVRLDEPAKATAAWSPGTQFPRRAFANVFDHSANKLYEAVVDLRAKQLVSWTPRASAQPAVYLSEYGMADALVHAYEPFKQAMRDRGIDPDDVYVDVWAPGDAAAPAPAGTRLLRALAFYRGKLPNPYDRPIEGVVITLDMNHDRVIDFVDTGARPVDTTNPGAASDQRSGLKPLVVQQPNGPSFTVDGRSVVWQGWHFRADFSPREGLVLDRVGYEENGAVRPIIYRLALAEIYVPYGLDDSNWTWRSAFDVGEYNLGQFAVEQEKNVDVPENAVFFDSVLAGDTGSKGGSYVLPHAIAMYERDAGSLWQRTDPTTFERDARFARELVVKSAYFIGNYTYEEEFVFHQDGSIEVHVNASGTTLNQGIASAADGNRTGKTVTPNIAAPNHQHFISFRIDFDVDGVDNRVVEQNIVPTASAAGNAFAAQETPLLTEQFRDSDGASNRSWVIENASKVNALGEPTGYALEPGDDGIPRQRPDFPALLRAPFAQHPFWVTRYKDGELYAAGDYPNQGQPGNGLSSYNSGESVDGRDVVAWYTLALTHHPRVEEYPVMPTESLGFRIVPDGFFDENPALHAPDQTRNGRNRP
jgi:primary-amine oxidase